MALFFEEVTLFGKWTIISIFLLDVSVVMYFRILFTKGSFLEKPIIYHNAMKD